MAAYHHSPGLGLLGVGARAGAAAGRRAGSKHTLWADSAGNHSPGLGLLGVGARAGAAAGRGGRGGSSGAAIAVVVVLLSLHVWGACWWWNSGLALKWAVASKCKHRTILAWCCLLLGTKARQNSSSEHISEHISTAARQNVQNRCVPTRSMCTTCIILAAALLRHLPRSLLRHLPGGRTQRSVATRSTQRFRKQHPFLCS